MELIPILSTIILVATISTFLLAIGAYVLYKIREGKEQNVAVHQPAAVKAEMLTPAEIHSSQQEQVRVVPQPVFIDANQAGQNRQPAFTQVYKPSVRRNPGWQNTPQPGQFNAAAYQQRGYDNTAMNGGSAAGSSNKYYKYTTEGYVSPKEDKQSGGTLKWR
jgi:hypothetical protein